MKRPETIQELEELIDKFDTWILDLDGTVWHSRHPIPGVAQTIELLRKRNKKLIFLTNNPISREELLSWFEFAKLPVDVKDIFAPAYAAALYLKHTLGFKEGERAYVLSTAGLEHELDLLGIEHAGGTDPKANEPVSHVDFSSITADPSIRAVICSHDTGLSYRKLAQACRHLQENQDCAFLVTSEDQRFKDSSNWYYPGPASSLLPVAQSCNKKPIVIGKPEPTMLDLIAETNHIDRERTIMVGDTLTSDIGFGKKGGLATLLVLTGVTGQHELDNAHPSHLADFCLESFGDLAKVENKN